MSGVLWVHSLLEKVKLKSKSQIKVREGESGVTQSNQLIIKGSLKEGTSQVGSSLILYLVVLLVTVSY